MTTQLSENMRFMGICVETKSAKNDPRADDPVGLADTLMMTIDGVRCLPHSVTGPENHFYNG